MHDPLTERTPRLPVYIIIDCSGTMVRVMPTVQRSLRTIMEALAYDPRAAGSAYISLIPFNDDAMPTPLTALPHVQVPALQALGKTQLGLALQALNTSLDRDLVPNRQLADGAIDAGDYRPLVFLISDGKPSDPERVSWRPQAVALRERLVLKPLHVVALAVGPDADVGILQEIADDGKALVITGDQLALEQALMDYFDWIRDAVVATLDAYTTLNGSPLASRLPTAPRTLNRAPARDLPQQAPDSE